jgi:hypothetical protein
LNILLPNSTYKLILGLTIVLGTGTFYVTRGLAKIKSNPLYRFESIFFLIFLAVGVTYELIVIALTALVFGTTPLLIDILVISFLAFIVFLPVNFAVVYFPIRYGARIPKLMRYFKEKDNA